MAQWPQRVPMAVEGYTIINRTVRGYSRYVMPVIFVL